MDLALASGSFVSGNGQRPVLRDANAITYRIAADILTDPLTEPDWVIRDIIAPGTLTTVGGYVGAGKSPLARRMCMALLRGGKFMGRTVEQRLGYRIVYLAEESQPSFELDMARLALQGNDEFEVVYRDRNARVPWDVMVARTTERLEGNGILLADTAFRWSGITAQGAENDPGQMNEVYEPLTEACNTGISVFVTAHTTKYFDRSPDDEASYDFIRGSGGVIASSETVLLYKRLEKDLTSNTRLLRFSRSKLTPTLPSDMYVTMDRTGVEMSHVSGVELTMQRMDENEQRALQHIIDHPGKGKTDLRTAWPWRKREFDTLVKGLVAAGKVERHGEGKAGNPYTYEVVV